MTKADKYMGELIEKILLEGYRDKNPRPKYKDGTPAYTYSVNHTYRTYDLAKSEFPICTLRPIAWKTAIREVLAIYQKPTNVISEMEEMGVTWWGDWDIGDGTIGQRYGATVKRYDLINNLIKDIKNDVIQTLSVCKKIEVEDCCNNIIGRLAQQVLRVLAPLL